MLSFRSIPVAAVAALLLVSGEVRAGSPDAGPELPPGFSASEDDGPPDASAVLDAEGQTAAGPATKAPAAKAGAPEGKDKAPQAKPGGPEAKGAEQAGAPDSPGAPGTVQLEGQMEVVPPVPQGPPPWGSLAILGKEVAPGEVRELSLRISESFSGSGVEIPVVAIRGEKRGPTLCLTAGIHGDELNGVEIVREMVDQTRARGLAGTIIAVPIANLHGFQGSSRYLPDRRDLNRFFPGKARGNTASRIAFEIFQNVIRHCDKLIDLHTGSFHRSNLPQIRADLKDPGNLALAKAFGATVIVHNSGGKGTLRRAAQDAGIPAIIYEAGEPMRFQAQEIKRGVFGVRNVLVNLGMIKGSRVNLGEQRIFYETRWVRAERGGILVNEVRLGDEVREGDILGTITDPIRKGKSVVVSPYRGRVIGMVLAPVMIPGYAAFHIGIPGNKPVDTDDTIDQDRPE
ncbi:succinylglutamate desuccinylase/aspartoacylase family protein [Vulgatibacter incomptus]|uniref:Putative deacylase n=1 Tax=Vulgatibacter incomptus TaxID=1391653 RepID=A0A0K1PA25_9BACT|nr:succinylglutamate desuccinylase/aspartoacylase family protein [Vulgatibacter incomptus]AKU89969.1 putative deacylase [Vulgatibacter incomptus]